VYNLFMVDSVAIEGGDKFQLTVPQEALQEQKYLYDDSTKIRTGNSPEQYCQKTGIHYADLFGLTREQKSFVQFLTSHQIPLPDNSYGAIDEAFFTISRYRNKLLYAQPDLPVDELDQKTLEFAVRRFRTVWDSNGTPLPEEYFFVDIKEEIPRDLIDTSLLPELTEDETRELQNILARNQDDILVNIGDPFEVIARSRNRKSTITVEYAPGDQETLQWVQGNTTELQDKLRQAYTDDVHGKATYATYSLEFEEQCGLMTDEEKAKDQDWMWYDSLDLAMGRATKKVREAGNDPIKMREALKEWDEAQKILHSRTNRQLYNKSDGLSPIDGVEKEARKVIQTAIEDLTVNAVYQEDIFPQLFNEYIEDIIQATEKPISDPESVTEWNDAWTAYLSARELDSAEVKPTENFDLFYDEMQRFLRLHGLDFLRKLNPDLGLQVKYDTTKGLTMKLPYQKKALKAEMIQAVFPHTRQLIQADSVDRVIAHWSITAHAMPHMNREETLAVWAEIDRIMRTGGKATLAPIGHYGAASPELRTSLESYVTQTGSKLKFTFSPSYDPRFPNDEVLVLSK
jgi:hypothetical protein